MGATTRYFGAAGLVALTAVLGAPAPAGAQDERGPPACAATVHGHVVDAGTHEPVAGATVYVDGEAVALTDDAGELDLDGLCPGEVTIEAERADYLRGGATVTLETSASLELELQRGGEVIVIEEEAPAPVDMRATAVVKGEALERTRGRSFSDALAEVPGVGQLRSASGLAKPIVRGQYGRRLVLLVDGVRHRSQEWGLDHAPEIDPFVADEITVVRGAAGVRYGSDAIGGAIVVEPPDPLRRPGVAGELHVVGLSNGRGGSVAGRVRGVPARVPGLALQLEGSGKRLAASETPDYPLDNTGAVEWNAGASAAYRAGDADYALSYRRYQARLGVCSCLRVESSEDFYAQLEREEPLGVDAYDADFAIERPYQAVAHDLVLARGSWRPRSLGKVTATYAFQFDHRREYDIVRDATTGPQFDFRLATHDVDVTVEHDPVHVTDHLHLRGTAGVAGMVQLHGFGGLPLVPDHQAWGAGVHASERLVGHDVEIEAGVRYDVLGRTAEIARPDFLRLVRSGQLEADACGGGEGDPVACDSTFHMLSASLGGLWQITRPWSVKLGLSTASRAPDPDEQYLNGTAPTFPVLGLGKPDIGAETTYAASVTTSYRGARVAAEASAYASFIDDYIELAPALDDDGEPIFDVLIRGTFPRFVTRPVNAVFYGADGGITARPLPWLELGGQVSLVRARNVSDDAYLAFVPPDRVRGSVAVRRGALGPLRDAFVAVDATYVARQKRFELAADLAPPPDAYVLVGAEVGAAARVRDQTVKLAVRGANLTNARYRDYTSFLRYFADQPGWQLTFRLSVLFSSIERTSP